MGLAATSTQAHLIKITHKKAAASAAFLIGAVFKSQIFLSQKT
ncbi:hypothetical protein PALI_a0620 [Pseudoalteromonas aliena SW19]|uniref:Uncharacterized protein n=1 Tax=Pseudoalteromonas aliena SW19 TaxID=1314866 RepID=A0ABR9DYD1_9GAMM|nr:hypothetical protein [Pseudoalteromonas aliena SW19]